MESTPNPSSRSAILAASVLTAINQLLINAQPLVFGALAVGIGLTDAELGQLASIVIAASTIGALSGPLWVRRVNWRLFSAITLIAAAVALATGIRITTWAGAAMVFGAVSLFLGLLAPPAFGCLGDARNSGRAFAVAMASQGLLAAIAALVLAIMVIPHFAAPGAFAVLAAMVIAGLPFARFLPQSGGRRKIVSRTIGGAPLLSLAAVPAYVMLLAEGFFVAGVLGYWVFVERIGVEHGISGELIGLTISLCAIASAVSAAIAGYLSGRVSPIAMIFAGTTIVLLAFALLETPGFFAFVVSNLCFAFGWGLAQTAYWGVLRDSDKTNRLFVAGPAAAGVGGAAAGLAAGPIAAIGGLTGVTVASGIYLIIGAGIALIVRFAATSRPLALGDIDSRVGAAPIRTATNGG